jgi:hypothetical protein
MADQWEICFNGINHIWIYTPKGVEDIHEEEFLKKHNKKPDERGHWRELVTCLLLADAWEPYAVSEGGIYFRRKYQG